MSSALSALFVFVLPCLAVGLALLLPAPPRWLRMAALWAPVLVIVAAYADAGLNERADRVALAIEAFEIGPDRAAGLEPGETRTVFAITDDPATGDLVVSSSADPRLAAIESGGAPRPLAEVRLRKAPNGDVRATLTLHASARDEAAGIAGMVAAASTPEPREPQAGSSSDLLLMPDEPVRLKIHRIAPDGTRSLRRSLSIAVETAAADGAAPVVVIRPDMPLRAAAGSCGGPDPMLTRLDPAELGGFSAGTALPAKALRFAGFGSGGSQPLIEPGLAGPLASPAVLCASEGELLAWPGAEAGLPPRLKVRVSVARLPLFVPAFVAILMASLIAIGAARTGRQVSAVSFVSLVLAYRLLAAVAAPFYDASLQPGTIATQALLALLTGSVVMSAIAAPARRARRLAAPLALLLAAGTVSIAAFHEAIPAPGALWPVVAGAGVLVWRAYGSPVATLPKMPLQRAAHVALVGIAALIAARLALTYSPLDARERLFGLPLSVPYTLTLIAAFALIAASIARAGQWGVLAGALVLALVATLLVPWLVHDSGYAFLAAPPILALLALAAIAMPCEGRLAPARFLAALPLLLLPAAVWLMASELSETARSIAEAGTLAQIETALALDGNALRLAQFADPSSIERVPTLGAMAAIDQQTVLADLARDLWGRGWLAPAELSLIRDVQLSDNLPAVHLFWPFGRIAGVAILFVYAAMTIAVWRAASALGSFDPRRIAAILAAVFLAWSALYMLLANLLIVPFIGRNVYLLAPSSGGDLLEGMLLAGLAFYPWQTARA